MNDPITPLSAWPTDATAATVQSWIDGCEAIAQGAANAGHGDLVGVAEDALAALKDLVQQVVNTIEAMED